MDEYNIFCDLASRPYSSSSLRMLGSALAIIKNRYPQFSTSNAETHLWAFPPREDFAEPKDIDIPVNDQWVRYMNDITSCGNTGDDRVATSLCRLATDEDLDDNVVKEYIELLRASDLLRASSPSYLIQQPTDVGTEEDTAMIDQDVKMILFPIRHRSSWLAAVAYPDCIHVYYNSDNDSYMGPEIMNWLSSTFPTRQIRCCGLDGPLQQHDSGLLMLQAMRMLASGSAPTRRSDADFVRNLRVRTFVEIQARNLNASDNDVVTLQQAFHKTICPHFDDALISGNTSPYGSDSSPSSSIRLIEDQSIHSEMDLVSREPPSRSGSYPRTPSSQVVPSRYRSNTQDSATDTSASNSLGAERSPRGSALTPPPMPQECKDILELLSEAVAYYRSFRLTNESDFTTLWSSITNTVQSEFYRRYNGVCFYEKTLGRSNKEIATKLKLLDPSDKKKLKALRNDFRLWYKICQLRESSGQGRYTLLCVVPKKPPLNAINEEEENALVSHLESRLNDKNDPFSGYIKSARNLCCSLIENNVPQERLMIENYHLKADWDILPQEFIAYTNAKPNPKIQIARMIV